MAVSWWIILATAQVVLVLGLAGLGLRGERLERSQACLLSCPRDGRILSCQIRQDIRTGQYRAVEACSAFDPGGGVPCDQACARRMNLGFVRVVSSARG